MGAGTSLMTANRTGIVIPINATIIKAVIVSSIKGSTTDMTSVPSIMINGDLIVSLENLRYSAPSNFVLSNINQSITAGDILNILLETTSGATPTNVTHKMILTLKPL
jgi:ABC-type siderophore export system fused ATPase/permease subunit